MFRHFPRRCCGITSELLAKYLLDNLPKNSIKLMYRSGTYYAEDQNHAWLQTSTGYVIDITVNQFSRRLPPLCFKESMYIGPYIDYYDIFDINYEGWCNNYYPLDDTPVRNHLTRKQLYEIIYEYID